MASLPERTSEPESLLYESPRATRRVPDGQRTRPTAGGNIALVIWFLFAGIALLVAVTTVSAFAGLTSGLAQPGDLDKLSFQEESIVYDRTGQTELARFGQSRREVVAFEDIPPIVVDAQTAIEDKTFWENTGFDPLAIVSAGVDSIRGRSRGASTITQQLVRQRLLDEDLVQDPDRQVERKLKEIIQSIRLTEAYPGIEGKRQIITAYLNQNYYGNQSYGIKAAAKSYFGKELNDLTVAEAAILAGLPKSPSNYDLVLNAVEECDVALAEDDTCPGKATLVVPEDTEIVQRRNQILDLMAEGDRNPLSAGAVRCRRLPGGQGREGRPGAAADAQLDRAAFRLGRSEGAHHQAVRRRRPDLRRTRERRPPDHHDARHQSPEDRREVGQGGHVRPAAPRTVPRPPS